jgi:iron complex outermembrane receptor protein
VWLVYDADAGAGRGFGGGGGVRAQSSQTMQFDTLTLEGFTVADAGLWYRFGLADGRILRVQLNADNLFDREHYVRASDRSIVHPGSPRSARVTVGIEF